MVVLTSYSGDERENRNAFVRCYGHPATFSLYFRPYLSVWSRITTRRVFVEENDKKWWLVYGRENNQEGVDRDRERHTLTQKLMVQKREGMEEFSKGRSSAFLRLPNRTVLGHKMPLWLGEGEGHTDKAAASCEYNHYIQHHSYKVPIRYSVTEFSIITRGK